MTRPEFEKLVAEALDGLPEWVRDKMDNVAVVVEGQPSAAHLKQGGTRSGSLLLGLYEGVPQSKRGPFYTLVLPDKITIFQDSIEAVAHTEGEIKDQVRKTVWHEVAHHFGFEEQAIRKLEQKRKGRHA